MTAFLSLMLTCLAAALTHLCVRYAAGAVRRGLFAIALLTLAAAVYWGTAFGGFWPGFYTLLSVYFLACIVTPWIDLYLARCRAR